MMAVAVLAAGAVFASPPQQMQVGNSDLDPYWGSLNSGNLANWNSPTATTAGALWINTGSGPVLYNLNEDVDVQLVVQCPAPYGWTTLATYLLSDGTANGDVTNWTPNPGGFYCNGSVIDIPGTDEGGSSPVVYPSFPMQLYVWTGDYNSYSAAAVASAAHTPGAYLAYSGVFNQAVSTSPLWVPIDLTDMPATILQTVIAGDANLDGRVDINDLTIVLAHYGQSVGPNGWSEGDFTGDGTVDINDLTIVLANYGRGVGSSAGMAAVPEPSTLALLGALAVGLLGCGWRKQP
jgi:hypothetical protein